MRIGPPTPTAALAAFLFAGALPLAAQAPERDRPPERPDSVLAPGETGRGFVEWREGIAARGKTGASYLIDGDRYQVLVLTPMAIDALLQDSLIVKATKGCQRALTLNDEQVEWTATVNPWREFDAAARARPLIAVAVYPKEQRRFDCHAGNLARFAALSRGALYGAFGPLVPTEQVATAEFRRDGLIEPTPLTGRAKVTKVTRTQVIVDGAEHVRLWVDPLAFAPDVEGRVANLEVHVYNPIDPEPDVLPLPERLIRAVWQQMLPWQARNVDGPDAELTPPAAQFDVPKDSALKVAHADFARGALGASASEVLTRLLFQPRPPQRDIRSAMVQSAVAFSLRDRDAEALFLISDVMEVYPCLTLAPEVPQELREMAEALRKPARCTTIPLPIIALRSVIPGFGQATTPLRRRMALTSFASTAGAYAVAEGLRAYARNVYADYRAYRGGGFTSGGPPNAVILYKRAQLARAAGNWFTVLAAGIWAGSAVEGLVHEFEQKRLIDQVQQVGRPKRRTVSVAPALSVDRVGLQVTFR